MQVRAYVTNMWGRRSRKCGVVGRGFWVRKLRVVEVRICRSSGGFGLRNAGVFATGKAGKAGALRLVFVLEMKRLSRWAGVLGENGFGCRVAAVFGFRLGGVLCVGWAAFWVSV